MQTVETAAVEDALPCKIPDEVRGGLATATMTETKEDCKKAESEVSRQLKKTCEACVRSKVKCDGSMPCERCVKRGVDCSYAIELKRGRRPGGSNRNHSRNLQDPNGSEDEKEPRNHKSNSSSPGEKLGAKQSQDKRPRLVSQPLDLSADQHLTPRGQSISWASSAVSNPAVMNPLFVQNAFLTSHTHYSTVQTFQPGFAWGLPQFNQLPVPYSLPLLPQTLPSITERRIIRTIFALFKHHHKCAQDANEERRLWFESRFNELRHMLCGKLPQNDIDSLNQWMLINGLNPDSPSLCVMNPKDSRYPQLVNLPLNKTQSLAPMTELGAFSLFPDGNVECDTSLKQVLGYTEGDLIAPPGIMLGSNLLPWGVDIIAKLAVRDEDVYGFALCVAKQFLFRTTETSVTKVRCEYPMFLNTRLGMPVCCHLQANALEAVAPDATVMQGLSVQVFLVSNPTGTVRSEFDPDVLGPWPSANQGLAQSLWLNNILAWA